MTLTALPQSGPGYIPEINRALRRKSGIQATLLDGDLGIDFLNEFNWTADAYFKGNPYLKVLRLENGVVTGSNVPSVILAASILRERGLHLPLLPDIENSFRAGSLDLQTYFVDLSLLLRTEDDPSYQENNPISWNLARQLAYRKISFSPEKTAVLPLSSLELHNSDKNKYGLSFRIRDNLDLREYPYTSYTLSMETSFETEDTSLETGIPRRTRIHDGSRKIWTRNEGLSVLSFHGGDLHGDSGGLAYSNPLGRILVMRKVFS